MHGVKSEEVHGTRYSDPSREGPRKGCWGYSKILTFVLIKRLLTTSFSVYANNNQKGFYNISFPETQKYFKAIVMKPGHPCFHLHQSVFKVEV